MHMLRLIIDVWELQNEDIYMSTKVANIEDKIRENHLQWLVHVRRQLNDESWVVEG